MSAWQVLAGPSPTQLTPLTTAPSTGFETTIALTSTQPYLAVAALDTTGKTLATSAAVHR